MNTKELFWNYVDHVPAPPKYSSMYVERLQELIKRANAIMERRREGVYFTEDDLQNEITIWRAEVVNAGVEL